VVKAELSLFQVQFEGLGGYAVELGEPALGAAPERLDAVDVVLALGELVVAVVDPEVPVKADVNQAIVTSPAVRMDDGANVHLAPDHRLQRGFGAVWDDFGVDLALALEDAENDRLAARTAPALAPDPVRAEVGLVNFDRPGQRRIGL